MRRPPSWAPRPSRERLGRVFIVMAVVFAITLVGGAALQRRAGSDADAGPVLVPGAVLVQVERVIDGDTLDVRSAATTLRVRLYGVDAPEAGERCADEATARLAGLAGEEVQLVPDARLEDAFRRELRYVYTREGASIDAALVREGLARAWREDGALRDSLVAEEAVARAEGRGCLWSQSG